MARADRVRVALAEGSGGTASDDLHPLLLRRLLVCSLIAAIGMGVYLALALVGVWHLMLNGKLQDAAISRVVWMTVLLRGVPAAVSGVAALVLWFRPPWSVRGLRTCFQMARV